MSDDLSCNFSPGGPILRLAGAMARQFQREIGTSRLPVVKPYVESFDGDAFGVTRVCYLDGRRLPEEARRRMAEWIVRDSRDGNTDFEKTLQDVIDGNVVIPVSEVEGIEDDPLAWG